MNSLIQNSYRRQEALTIHKIALAPESQRKSSLQVEDRLWCKFFATFQSSVLIRILRAAPLRVRRHHWSRRPSGWRCRGRCPRRVHVCLLLGFDNVLLVSDPLVAKPVTDLKTRLNVFLEKAFLLNLPEIQRFHISWQVLPWLPHLDTDWTSESRNTHWALRWRSCWSSVACVWRPGTWSGGSWRPRKWTASAGLG